MPAAAPASGCASGRRQTWNNNVFCFEVTTHLRGPSAKSQEVGEENSWPLGKRAGSALLTHLSEWDQEVRVAVAVADEPRGSVVGMSEQKTDPGAIMRELEVCEQDIQGLVRLMEETVEELSRLPESNPEKIDELSSAYLSKLKSVQQRLKQHSQVLLVPAALGAAAGGAEGRAAETESFLSRQQYEIDQSLRLLDEK